MGRHFCVCARCRRDEEVARLLSRSVRGVSDERPVLPDEDIDESPIIRTANSILFEAISRGATEVYVQPRKRDVRVLYRVKGWLREGRTVPKSLQDPLLIRLKIMASLDIVAAGVAQTGQISIMRKGLEYDLDVSVAPGDHGERIVLRVRA